MRHLWQLILRSLHKRQGTLIFWTTARTPPHLKTPYVCIPATCCRQDLCNGGKVHPSVTVTRYNTRRSISSSTGAVRHTLTLLIDLLLSDGLVRSYLLLLLQEQQTPRSSNTKLTYDRNLPGACSCEASQRDATRRSHQPIAVSAACPEIGRAHV